MSDKETLKKETVVEFDGVLYRKLERDEVIAEGAVHTYEGHGPFPIGDPDTVGDVPNSFSKKRTFYNPL